MSRMTIQRTIDALVALVFKTVSDINNFLDARAYKLLPKLMNPLIEGMIQKAVEKDMDAKLIANDDAENAPLSYGRPGVAACRDSAPHRSR